MHEGFWSRAASVLGCTTMVMAFGLPLTARAQQGAATGAARVVVIGCLKGSGQGRAGGGANAPLTIVDFRGGPSPTFQVDGSDTRLNWHVGHTVEIAGTIAPGGRGGAMGQRLNVQSVNYISTSCWEPPKTGAK